ncbi:hypothetical protein TorRG33x02_236740 [Trema orientale]|uniref:Uncharacterized protein n=1 Tax=Trema orientale TaxID=63057 RepID=A0A2P5E074_TREOI|nr:hypothetical protein TorRG33x02_236740 [Trema orientale]
MEVGLGSACVLLPNRVIVEWATCCREHQQLATTCGGPIFTIIEANHCKNVFHGYPQPSQCGSWSFGSWTTGDHDESPQPSQSGSFSSYNYDLRKEHAEKTTLKVENPGSKHADLESLVAAEADLERKDTELRLLREFLNETIKELQADVAKWRTKYLHAKMTFHLNGIPFVDS